MRWLLIKELFETLDQINPLLATQKLFACSRNKSISCLSMSHREKTSSMKRFHTVDLKELCHGIFSHFADVKKIIFLLKKPHNTSFLR